MNDEAQHDKNGNLNPAMLPGRSLDLKVAAAALVAFMVFMYLLTRWLFPEGMSLNQEDLSQSRDDRNTAQHVELSYSGRQDTGATVAEVLVIRRNVEVKSRDALAWMSASKGALLADRDSLQTLRNSSATVQLDDNSQLQIGPDSLIVFQGAVPDPFTPARTNSIIMMAGTLDAQFTSSQSDPMQLEVALPNGLARFISGDNDTAVAFNVNINPDLSSSVSVHAGTGVLNVGGNTATVDAEHGITIGANGEVLEQGRLPARPGAARPRNNAVFRYRALPPEVAFSWQPVPGADRYRFRLSRDHAMKDLVIDERLDAPRLDYGGLGDGNYYWQISAMTGFIEGPAAGPHEIRLVRDLGPPSLQLEPSEVLAGANTVVVRGRTDRGASVFVQGEKVVLDGTRFEQRVAIDPGATVIVVEAVDSAGNVAYESEIVNSNIAINGGGK